MNTSTISVSMNPLTSNVRSVNVSSDCLRYLVNLTKNFDLQTRDKLVHLHNLFAGNLLKSQG